MEVVALHVVLVKSWGWSIQIVAQEAIRLERVGVLVAVTITAKGCEVRKYDSAIGYGAAIDNIGFAGGMWNSEFPRAHGSTGLLVQYWHRSCVDGLYY